MKHKSFVMFVTLTLILAGCSYVDGVFRSLSFDREINQTDLLCLTDTLISQGYNARYSATNRSIYYDLKHHDLDHIYSASFRVLERDKDGKLIEASKGLGHGATYGGSEPNACEVIKPAASILVSIEDQVLPVCNLTLAKKPTQKIRCKK